MVDFKVQYLKVFVTMATIYHLVFLFNFGTTPEVLVNFTLLKYVKSQRSYGFLITQELIFDFQIYGKYLF